MQRRPFRKTYILIVNSEGTKRVFFKKKILLKELSLQLVQNPYNLCQFKHQLNADSMQMQIMIMFWRQIV